MLPNLLKENKKKGTMGFFSRFNRENAFHHQPSKMIRAPLVSRTWKNYTNDRSSNTDSFQLFLWLMASHLHVFPLWPSLSKKQPIYEMEDFLLVPQQLASHFVLGRFDAQTLGLISVNRCRWKVKVDENKWYE